MVSWVDSIQRLFGAGELAQCRSVEVVAAAGPCVGLDACNGFFDRDDQCGPNLSACRADGFVAGATGLSVAGLAQPPAQRVAAAQCCRQCCGSADRACHHAGSG